MYTSYAIEMIASSNHREAIAAAEQRRLVRALRSAPPAEAQLQAPATGTIRIPRPRRWFGVAVAGR